jgi:hypothetical protein
MHRHQLDGGHAQPGQVVDDDRAGQARIGAALPGGPRDGAGSGRGHAPRRSPSRDTAFAAAGHPAQSKYGLITTLRGMKGALSRVLIASGAPDRWENRASCQRTRPATALPYGSSSSFAALHR